MSKVGQISLHHGHKCTVGNGINNVQDSNFIKGYISGLTQIFTYICKCCKVISNRRRFTSMKANRGLLNDKQKIYKSVTLKHVGFKTIRKSNIKLDASCHGIYEEQG